MFVQGFGLKGVGKGANYGVGIPPPTAVDPQDLPLPLQQTWTSSEAQDALGFDVIPPPPVAATSEMVEEWVSSLYRPLTNISTEIPPPVGASVLWRGIKPGKHGGPSTKVEYFNGKVRGITTEPESGEIYCDVD